MKTLNLASKTVNSNRLRKSKWENVNEEAVKEREEILGKESCFHERSAYILFNILQGNLLSHLSIQDPS
jgi:hypothetical protein